jgi:hypothetical protein
MIMTTTNNRTDRALVRLDDLTGIRGQIITRGDPGYDQARAVYNGAVNRHPLAVVRVADVADVMACVGYARDRRCRSPYAAAATMAGDSASGMTRS